MDGYSQSHPTPQLFPERKLQIDGEQFGQTLRVEENASQTQKQKRGDKNNFVLSNIKVEYIILY